MTITDPFEIIKAMPPGSALYGRAGQSSENLETCFLIREDEEQVRKIPENPIVELRSGFWEGPVCLVSVMIRLAGLPYETWWNYHQPDGFGKTAFEDMISQAMLLILVYDHRQMRRSIGVKNSLATVFREYRDRILQHPPWGMKDFDEAREKVAYAKHPSVKELWEALG